MRVIFLSCAIIWFSHTLKAQIALSYSKDSALHYYRSGRDQVMNKGNYSLSEVYFRKAYQLDSGFILGASLLYRITTDTIEKRNLAKFLSDHVKSIPHEDEKKLVEIYTSLGTRVNIEWSSILKTMDALIRKYPGENYLFAEYIELIKRLNGPGPALDTLNTLGTEEQLNMPFLLSYTTQLWLDKGLIKEAQMTLNQLETVLSQEKTPRLLLTQAAVAIAENKNEEAIKYLNNVIAADPKNLDAKRYLKSLKK